MKIVQNVALRVGYWVFVLFKVVVFDVESILYTAYLPVSCYTSLPSSFIVNYFNGKVSYHLLWYKSCDRKRNKLKSFVNLITMFNMLIKLKTS